MDKNITSIKGGLNLDASRLETPESTYTFALNAVNETETGDAFFLSNEESNELCGQLPNGYTPIGKVYIGEGRTAIFSVSDDGSLSQIGIRNKECFYKAHVTADLGFKVDHQIDATYRKRRGCETTVYWVDGKNNKPMFFVFESPERFQDEAENWVKAKFELQRSYEEIPTFESVTVDQNGGALAPGSYNIAIQYQDANFNPTEWITTSEVIVIYNDDETLPYPQIGGAINKQKGEDYEDYRTYGITDKAIKVLFGNLDSNFPYYRLAFLEATTGSGLVNNVRYSSVIPVENPEFVYTGNNFEIDGTLEEVRAVTSVIESAGSILQSDNMLLLGNTQGKQIEYCKLQAYASKIAADMQVKTINTTDTKDANNPKSSIARFDGVGYMPGEIYSFGIVYVFEDGTQSPVYHIPGKSSNILSNASEDISNTFIHSPVEGESNLVYPMSADNQGTSVYTDNSSCQSGPGYWGKDFLGNDLVGQNIRHHRFPKRADLGLPMIVENLGGGQEITTQYYQVAVNVSGELNTSFLCTEDDIDNGDCDIAGNLTALPIYNLRLKYNVDGLDNEMIIRVTPAQYAGDQYTTYVDFTEFSNYEISNNITIEDLYEATYTVPGVDGYSQQVELTSIPGQNGSVSFTSTEHGNLTYTASIVPIEFNSETRQFQSNIYGIKFSNITMPDPEDTNGEKVVGYYIVRNERTESEKTILDSAVLMPTVENAKYISQGLIYPEFDYEDESEENKKINTSVWGMLHPEHKFNDNRYSQATTITQQGTYQLRDKKYSKATYGDVMDGSGFDASVHKSGNGDDDGWNLRIHTRDNIVDYTEGVPENNPFNMVEDDVEDIFYLSALESRPIKNNQKDVFNLAADNQIGILELKEEFDMGEALGNVAPLPNLNFYQGVNVPEIADYTENKFTLGEGTWNMQITIPIVMPQGITMRETWQMQVIRIVDDNYAGKVRDTVGWRLAIDGIDPGYDPNQDTFVPMNFDSNSPSFGTLRFSSITVPAGEQREVYFIIRDVSNLPLPTAEDQPAAVTLNFTKDGVPANWFNGDVLPDTLGYDDYRDNIALPYVYLERPVADNYSTFRTLPYYKAGVNMESFYNPDGTYNEDSTSTISFSGDSHITSMRYVNTMFWDNVLAKRAGKTSAWDYVLAVVLVVVAVVVSVFSFGAGAALSAVLVGAAITLVGAAATFIASGVKQDALVKAYYSEYDKGLRETLLDKWIYRNKKQLPCERGTVLGLCHTAEDDQIEWFADAVTDFWFESQVNMGLRYRMTGNVPSYMDSPGQIESGETAPYGSWEYFDIWKQTHNNIARYPVTALDKHVMNKLTTFDPERDDSRLYVGVPTGEYYEINPDFNRLNLEKTFFHLPLEYDCCTDCQEDFPHRIHYSLQSYQEEINDNFRIFSPNDYTDIEGETGQITDLFRIKNNIYIHTEDSLWHQPQNFQERVTGDIVSFLGTGSYFSVPPRKIVDSNESSAGNMHKWGSLKTKHGVYFASEKEGRIYLFDGNTLSPLTDTGIMNWAKENLPLKMLSGYFDADDKTYPFDNNPSNKYGVGFISVYDRRKERIIFTKKDKIISDTLASNQDNELSVSGENLYLLPSFNSNISSRAVDNWDYVGIENNKQKFVRTTYSNGEFIGGNFTSPETGGLTVPVGIQVLDKSEEIEFEDNELLTTVEKADNSWTLSYSLKAKTWTSWHSYTPDFYYSLSDIFYSWKEGKKIGGKNAIWRHNVKGKFGNIYNELVPFSVEYTSLAKGAQTKIWEDIQLHTEARKYDAEYDDYYEVKDKTFNKGIFYNQRQCSGEVTLTPKGDLDDQDYMLNQVTNNAGLTAILDNNEGVWSLNDIRDIRVDYEKPIFDSNILSRQDNYYTDKILNSSALDENKNWQELESLRGKYLVVRLIFDNFADVKLVMNYAVDTQHLSQR